MRILTFIGLLLACVLILQIGDLGLSKVKQHTLVSGGVRGTLPWMAPELLSGKSNMVTEKVISFMGIFFRLEIFDLVIFPCLIVRIVISCL